MDKGAKVFLETGTVETIEADEYQTTILQERQYYFHELRLFKGEREVSWFVNPLGYVLVGDVKERAYKSQPRGGP